MNEQSNSTNIFDDDDVVITGLAGVYPKSENAREFCKNLFAKKDLTSEVDPVWKSGKNRSCCRREKISLIDCRFVRKYSVTDEGPQFSKRDTRIFFSFFENFSIHFSWNTESLIVFYCKECRNYTLIIQSQSILVI